MSELTTIPAKAERPRTSEVFGTVIETKMDWTSPFQRPKLLTMGVSCMGETILNLPNAELLLEPGDCVRIIIEKL